MGKLSTINKIKKAGRIEATTLQFSSPDEIIPLHIWRYNRQIQSLIAIKEIRESEVDGEVITWKQFFDARNRKIRAYTDCVDTLHRKEELLQFHKRDLIVDMSIKERVVIKESKSKTDVTKLTLSEQIELYNLLKKSKKNENEVIGIIWANTEHIAQVMDIYSQKVETPNVEEIKQEELIAPVVYNKISTDPTIRLREALLKMAAKEFVKAGGTLDEEEKELIK